MGTVKIKPETIRKSVKNSQKIEGYITRKAEVREQAKDLLEKLHVKISLRK